MADCKSCKVKEQHAEPVPFIVHEGNMERAERTAKRLWITILLLIVLLVGTNGAWIWYQSQFEYCQTTQEVMQESNHGDNSFIGGDVGGEWAKSKK